MALGPILSSPLSSPLRPALGGGAGWWPPGSVLAFDFEYIRAYNSLDSAKRTPDSILTYTAPSPKMVYGSDGVLRYAPHNLTWYSEAPTSWTAMSAGTRTNAATANPLTGEVDAVSIVPDGTTTRHAQLIHGLNIASVGRVNITVIAKSAGYNFVGFGPSNGSGVVSVVSVNLTTGAFVQANDFSTASFVTGSLISEDLGGGWWKLTGTWLGVSGIGIVECHALPLGTASITSYAGNSVDGVFLYRPHMRNAPASDTYIKTSSNAARYALPIDHDPVTLAPLGVLIKEQRTNLNIQSQTFDNAHYTKFRCPVTANAVAAPDGTTTADHLVPDATSNTHLINSAAITVSASTAYDFTVYAKANGYSWLCVELGNVGAGSLGRAYFDLTNGVVGSLTGVTSFIQSVGNGWYRCEVRRTSAVGQTQMDLQLYVANADPGAGSSPANFSGDTTSGIYLWGAQLEAGAFPTSYIPTVASQVTRAADQVSILTSAFAYNAAAGTMVAAARAILANSLGAAASVNDGTGNEEIVIYRDASGNLVYQVEDGGANQLDPLDSGQNAANLTEYKMAAAWGANDFAAAVNGNAAVTDTSGTLPTVTTLEVGVNQANNYFNGTIKRLTYFPTRRTDADLQGLTT